MVVVRSTRNTELGLQATLALLIGAPPAGCARRPRLMNIGTFCGYSRMYMEGERKTDP